MRSDRSQLYTLGVWMVKPSMEQSFINAWQEFADWTSNNQAGAGVGILLQDDENPQRFISFGPWDKAENIAKWRSKPEFQDFISKARELCEDFKPQTMRVAGYSNVNNH